MSEERTQILEMLAKGKLSVEDAQELLAALAAGERATGDAWTPPVGRAARPARPGRPRHRHRPRHRRGRHRHSDDDLIDQVLHLRIHGIDGRFIAEMKEMGLADLTAEQLVALKIHSVTPGFIKEIRDAGLTEVTVDELVALAIHGIDADFIREMRAITSRDLTVDQLVALRIHDVTPEVFTEILNLGVVDLKRGKATAATGAAKEGAA
jgi:hypothetical protein